MTFLAVPSHDLYLLRMAGTKLEERSTFKLDELLENESLRNPDPASPAVFDCDGTLIQGDIGEAMLYFQLEHLLFRVSPAEVWPDHPRRKELNELYETLSRHPRQELKHDRRSMRFGYLILSWYFNQLAEGKTKKACADIVRLCSGFTCSEIRAIADETVQAEFRSGVAKKKIGGLVVPHGIRFIQESLTMLRTLNKAGFPICIVSGSNRWSVEAVLRRADVHPDRVIGIDLVDVDGVLCSAVKEPVPVLRGKVEALKQFYEKRPAIVVSDSIYDIALFRYSTDLKILVQSRGSHVSDFFKAGRVKKDGSWFVIDHPTLLT